MSPHAQEPKARRANDIMAGTSAFHYLIRFKVHPKQRDLFLSVLSTMRSLGQDIDVQNQNGETPLHQAALEGCLIAIRWLLASGAEVDKKTCYGETPLHFACRVSQRETVLLLLEAGASLDIEVRNPLFVFIFLAEDSPPSSEFCIDLGIF